MTSVAQHLAVPEPARDIEWLKAALQLAVALEHAALLPYIAATYSLMVHNYTAYNLLRAVAMEEMAHMATAANMLAAIGGKPADPRPGAGLPRQGACPAAPSPTSSSASRRCRRRS